MSSNRFLISVTANCVMSIPIQSRPSFSAASIVVPHPQVSARHAQITTAGGQLLLEDLGSGNGTFVRGQRLTRGQKVPVANGEKVYIGPMPVLFTTIKFVPAGGAKLSANSAVSPVAENSLTVAPTLPVEANAKTRGRRVTVT